MRCTTEKSSAAQTVGLWTLIQLSHRSWGLEQCFLIHVLFFEYMKYFLKICTSEVESECKLLRAEKAKKEKENKSVENQWNVWVIQE